MLPPPLPGAFNIGRHGDPPPLSRALNIGRRGDRPPLSGALQIGRHGATIVRHDDRPRPLAGHINMRHDESAARRRERRRSKR